ATGSLDDDGGQDHGALGIHAVASDDFIARYSDRPPHIVGNRRVSSTSASPVSRMSSGIDSARCRRCWQSRRELESTKCNAHERVAGLAPVRDVQLSTPLE